MATQIGSMGTILQARYEHVIDAADYPVSDVKTLVIFMNLEERKGNVVLFLLLVE